jgi:hypothetical protein
MLETDREEVQGSEACFGELFRLHSSKTVIWGHGEKHHVRQISIP